jgi:uncharacterized protein
MPVPQFFISANGQDVTGRLAGILTSMTITDNEGLTADTLELELNDLLGTTAVPETGAILNPIGGYAGNLRDYGLFEVDNVSLVGWPQKITVSAQSVAAKSLAKQREPKAYPKERFPTYGDIFRTVAGVIGVQLSIANVIAAVENVYEAQADEDGLEFVARLGDKLNASISIKQQRLVVVEKGMGLSASGQPMGITRITRPGNLISYNVTMKDAPRHKEVEATYFDRSTNKREVVTETTGLDGPKFLLRYPYQDKAEAQRTAKSKATDLVMAQAEATFEIEGDPHVSAGSFAECVGARDRVDGLWKIKTVTHTFSSDNYFGNSLQCDVPANGGADG